MVSERQWEANLSLGPSGADYLALPAQRRVPEHIWRNLHGPDRSNLKPYCIARPSSIGNLEKQRLRAPRPAQGRGTEQHLYTSRSWVSAGCHGGVPREGTRGYQVGPYRAP